MTMRTKVLFINAGTQTRSAQQRYSSATVSFVVGVECARRLGEGSLYFRSPVSRMALVGSAHQHVRAVVHRALAQFTAASSTTACQLVVKAEYQTSNR
jgi:hypothetical protein